MRNAGPAREFEALDGLRGWAVLMVFNVHFFTDYWQKNYGLADGSPLRPLLATIHTGHVGVDLFFVLSGFLIYYTLRKRPTSFAVFARRRYARLLPAHFAVLLPLLLCAPWAQRPRLAVVVENALLVQSLVEHSTPINFVTWSLSYEILWYGLAALWLLAGYRRAFFRGYLFFFLVCGLLYGVESDAPSLLLRAGVKCPEIPRFMGFLFGFGVAKIHFESPAAHPLLRRWLIFLGPLALGGVIAVRYAWTRFEPLRTVPWFANEYYFALDLCFAVLLLALLLGDGAPRRLFSLAPLRALGRISYSFYLVHAVYALPLMARLLHRPENPTFLDMSLAWLVALGITTAMGCAGYLLFERPYLKSRQAHSTEPAAARAA